MMFDDTIEGRRPWVDAPRQFRGGPESHDTNFARYQVAIIELRSALADGKWHARSIAVDIAKRHAVRTQVLCDRAGVYLNKEYAVWPNARWKKI